MARPTTTPLATRAAQPDEVPERTTSAQQALDREADLLRSFGVTAASRRHDSYDDNHGRALTLDDFPEHEEYQ